MAYIITNCPLADRKEQVYQECLECCKSERHKGHNCQASEWKVHELYKDMIKERQDLKQCRLEELQNRGGYRNNAGIEEIAEMDLIE